MFENNDKRKLYYLMDQFIESKISPETFCDEFYYCFDLELADSGLSHIEEIKFSELSEVSSRYSGYESDHLLDPNAFFSKQELLDKIIETKNILNR